MTEAQPQKKAVRRCFNCRHASKPFKLASGTHHNCLHPNIRKNLREGIDEPSAYDSLTEWHSSCDQWEGKP